MRYVVFSDTHSNLEALGTFLDYTKNLNIDRYLMLGDIVGYGANPQEVCDLVFKTADTILLGNHDQAIYDDTLLDWFHDEAKEAILWTRKHLNASTVERLASLGYTRVEEGFTLVHSSPYQPETFPYIDDRKSSLKAFRAFATPLCFVGHTHVPALFSKQQHAAYYLKEGTYQLSKGDRYIINCGSLGQPRDPDKRLSFGVFDEEAYTVQIIRLNYPSHETAQKIRDAGLPRYFAARLLSQ
ncbi:MAG: metallophosphoesterase family protein [Candidatus Omnitrophica bacterium]|nr:metallophosphoesterase family protein [Candidatus Omnitrophota bacterium]